MQLVIRFKLLVLQLYYIASIVAEEFGNTFPQFKAPVVGSGGSSGGLKQFCQGVGDNTIDCKRFT
jgi:ABC-type phosphate transport system substrate-binding protein